MALDSKVGIESTLASHSTSGHGHLDSVLAYHGLTDLVKKAISKSKPGHLCIYSYTVPELQCGYNKLYNEFQFLCALYLQIQSHFYYSLLLLCSQVFAAFFGVL